MFKSLFVATLLATSISYADHSPIPVCSCTQSYEDFEGYKTDYTVNVECPTTITPDIDCYATTTKDSFITTCASIEGGFKNETKYELDGWSQPIGGFAYCRLK